ncbi:MAG: nucleotide exchange factor GrpE [Planctomycetes bacterium]|nr:nucleotide exchange factor GrpE [Planctomycetota bacterium]
MSPFLGRWFRSDRSDDAQRIAALEREASHLRDELAENRFLMNQWREELTRARAGFSNHIDDAVHDRVGHLLTELAPMLAAIAGLARDPGAWRDADMGDVAAWVERTSQVLRKYGVETMATPGASLPFDPAWHECVVGRANDGQTVVVRTPAYAYQGRVLVKAAVAAPPPARS